MSQNTTILITGGNRGVGKGLVTTYLSTPKSTVIAAVRDTAHLTANALQSLPKAEGSSLIVLQLDVSSVQSIKNGIAALSSEHNIDVLDVVIANAGVADLNDKLSGTPVSELQRHIDVNAWGNFELFKAVQPLMTTRKDKKGKFVYISSLGGSLNTMQLSLPLPAYGASKALGNFIFKWLALESDDVIIWSQNPGSVATERVVDEFENMRKLGVDVDNIFISPIESGKCIKALADTATIEKNHGKFLGHDGMEVPW